jgi:hypothetical protein
MNKSTVEKHGEVSADTFAKEVRLSSISRARFVIVAFSGGVDRVISLMLRTLSWETRRFVSLGSLQV